MNLPYDNPAIPPVDERETVHEGFLQRHFDVAFAAPEGIKKLRELILTLAMQGKLVPQDPNDLPASELLKGIEAEKQRLVKEGKIKMPKPLPAIKPEEVPYQLPQGWAWVRLGNISEYVQRGKGPNYSDIEDIPVISQKCIQWSGFDKSAVRFIEPFSLSKYQNERFVRNGDLLWNSTGTGTIGRINIYRNELSKFKKVVVDSHVTIVRLIGICNEFVLNYLMSPGVQEHIEENASGTTNQIELNTTTVINQIVPLPPLAEQYRIVAKIDQLMARCDELENLRAEREQKRRAVHHAALKRLLATASSFPRRRESSVSDHSPGSAGQAPRLCGRDSCGSAGKEAFADAWQFITRHFNELYSVKENVTELRKAILQLAVMGKLVPQDPNDPPASTLLKAIEAEKQRLVKEGKIKAAKPPPTIQPEEVPYELPQGWEWVRLGDAILSMDAGWSPKCDERSAFSYEWGVLKTTSVQPLCFWPHENKVLPKKFEPRPNVEVIEGDILITRAGPRNRVGICCVAKSVRSHLMLSDKIIRFRIFGDLIFSDFCALCLNAGYGSHQIEKMKSGMADSQMNISQDKVKQIVIPLPHLPEQHRIVAKVDQLMALCDTLENQIDAASNQQTALLNALMARG